MVGHLSVSRGSVRTDDEVAETMEATSSKGLWSRVGALLGTIGLLAACSGGGDPGSAPAAAEVAMTSGAEPELVSSPDHWDDGYDHVVVLTERAATAGAIADQVVLATDEDTAIEAFDTATSGDEQVASGAPVPSPVDRQMVVVHADGTTETRTVPDGSLPTTQPITQAEYDLIAEYADQPLAVLVQDVDGVIGRIDARYLMVPGMLIEVGGDTTSTTDTTDETEPAVTTDTPDTLDSPDTPDTAEPADDAAAPTTDADPSGDRRIVSAILDLPGIVSADLVAPGVIAVATTGDREALRQIDGVVGVEDDTLFMLADEPSQGVQWSIENTGASSQAGGWPGVAGADSNVKAAWTISQGSGITVAVIDSGVDIDHSDLAANIWTNGRESCGNGVDDDGNGFVDDCRGWDFGANDSDPRPESGTSSGAHGTHVAGLIGAPRNGVGIAGIAPQAKLMALKVAMPGGQLSTSAIYSAIVYAVDNGAQVINLSLGTSPGTPRSGVTAMEQAIAYAGTRGVTVVAAAGNNGVDIGASAVYPANFSLYYSHVITIGATTNSDTRASFSNHGTPVNLYAPGWWMWSTVPGSWDWMSGTSMATPVVAGGVADLLASGQVTTPQEVKARLIARADTTSAGPRLDVGSAVGVGLPAAVTVAYGADALVPDEASDLRVSVSASNTGDDVTRARVSIAALVGGQVYAVSGLPISVTPPGAAPVTLVTDDDGAAGPITVDRTALTGSGWNATASLTLPAGEYAVVTELLDGSGTTVGDAQVGFLTVSDTPDSGVSTTAPSGDTTTTVPAGGGTGGGTATTVPQVSTTVPAGGGGSGGAVTTVPQVSTTLPSGGGTATTVPGSSTTVASGGGTGGNGGSATTAPATTAPVTTAPRSVTTTSAAPVTTSPAPGTTAPASGVTTTAPTTTVPTTTPTPPPDSSGQWRLDSMTPRWATTAGGEVISLSGRFPTTVPVYVWFGDAVVQAESTGSTLAVRAPAVAATGVVDVSVKFRTTSDQTMTLAQAFTYVAPSGGGGGGGGGGTATTTTVASGVTTTTVRSGGGTATTAPATPTTTPTTPTTPTTTPAPGTTAPSAGSPGASTSTTLPTLGSLRLRQRPASGALSRLSANSWPSSGCRSSSCPATSL